MESKPVNREWVKNAAIIFLVILLILTFFSNTIMNIALPEVATQAVNSGSITAKVRGTGTVTANGFYEVKADQTREVRSVMVRAGQQVNAGDVLFVLGSGDSEELKAAQEELRALEVQYQTTALSTPVYNYASQDAEIINAERDVEAAEEQLKLAEARWIKYISEEGHFPGYKPEEVKDIINKVATAKDDYDKAKKAYDDMIAADEALDQAAAELEKAKVGLAANGLDIPSDVEAELNTLQSERDGAKNKYENLLASSTPAPTEGEGEGEEAGTEEPAVPPTVDPTELAEAKAAYEAAEAKYQAILAYDSAVKKYTEENSKEKPSTTERIEKENRMLDTQKKYEALWKFLNEQNNEYWDEYKRAENALNAAQDRVTLLQIQRDALIESNNRSAAIAGINLGEIASKIAQKKKLIEELSGGAENQIISNVSGTVQTVNCTAGKKVPKDETMCTIEIPDQGYSLSFAVTSEQARRLHTGDTATVSNYYWGREVIATLTAIKADPKNPQGSKILEFDLKGEVNAGADLTISIGQKSANYDLVVPNSAIRKDGNGSFVYAIEAKNSPLGNRYYAKRVKVEVLASDDINSAVTGDLTAWSDYVITTSSTLINNKDQVRMADA